MSGAIAKGLKNFSSYVNKFNYVQCVRFSQKSDGYRIGFVGCGNMGARMSANLMRKGHQVMVYDNNAETVEKLKKEKFQVAKNLDELVEYGNCFITMLPNGPTVIDFYGGNNGIAKKMKKGNLIIDCSTVDPRDAIKLRPIMDSCGAEYVDAPVSGGIIGAAKATLTFMVGGEKSVYEKAKHILSPMGSNVIYCGQQGNGQVAKICNNMLLAISMIGVSEALSMSEKMGLDTKLMLKILNISTGRCWSSEVYSPVPNTMENVPSSNSYIPGFQSAIMLKDLRIAKDSAESYGAPIPLGKTAWSIYEDLCKTPMGDLDFSVVYKYLDSIKSK